MEVELTDAALTMFDKMMGGVFRKADRRHKEQLIDRAKMLNSSDASGSRWKNSPCRFLPLRKLQSHGVVMGNEALDKSSCILLGKGAAWPERIEFEAAVPSLDFTVALRVIRGGSDMGSVRPDGQECFLRAGSTLLTKSCEQFQDG
jgi:hypothetical protein